MKIWIVVVNYNGWEDTWKCLRSLTASTAPASTVLVDNASAQDRLAEARDRFPRCHAVRNPVNGGWAGGNNTGIRFALERGADQVLLLNNDTTVAPRLGEAMLAAAAPHPAHGLLPPALHLTADPA